MKEKEFNQMRSDAFYEMAVLSKKEFNIERD